MTTWWTYVIVALALIVSGAGGPRTSFAHRGRDAEAAWHAPTRFHLAKRAGAASLDARVLAKSGSHAAIASQPSVIAAPVLVAIGATAAPAGADLGRASARQHGARAPPQA